MNIRQVIRHVLLEHASLDLEQERQRLMTWPREKLIGWLQWNDPNGAYSDEDAIRDDFEPLDVPTAVDLIMAHVEEAGETPEEMMGGSLAANPQRYPKPEQFDYYLKS